MEVSRATVVAEPGPLAEDIAERRAREGAKRREPIEEPPVGRKHPCDLRLLQHYLADEDAVGIARVPPRKVAAGAAVPGEDPPAKRRLIGRWGVQFGPGTARQAEWCGAAAVYGCP